MDPQAQPESESPVFHEMTKKTVSQGVPIKIAGIFIVATILAIGSGYILAQKTQHTASLGMSTTSGGQVAKGTVYGSNDTATFKDMAEGTLQQGGISGEGQFHLVRVGGDSQNVYLTSSIVDLSQFINKKIKVFGQTQKAKYAGWLMDVGRVEVE